MESIKEMNINDYLNTFFCQYYENNYLIFHNIGNFYDLSQFIYEQTSLKGKSKEIDWYKVSKSSFLKNIDLINTFFKIINVKFNIEDIINDGTIDITTNDLEDTIKNNKYKLEEGCASYLDDHRNISINNNGLITDSIVWIHEISHYRNQNEIGRNGASNLLTEALAATIELIYIDYLEKMGYIYEAHHSRMFLFNFFHSIARQAHTLTTMFLLYEELNDTSKEAYKYLYGNDENYDKEKEAFINIITRDKIAIFKSIEYTVSAAYSIYMYDCYRKDNNFMENIERLNTCLLNNKDLITCLNQINLDENIHKTVEKIKAAYYAFKEELNKARKRTLKK